MVLPHWTAARHVQLGYALRRTKSLYPRLLTTVQYVRMRMRCVLYCTCTLQLIALRTFSPALFTFLARRGLPVRRVRRVRPLLLALPAESHPQQAAEPGQGMRPPAAF